MKTTVLLIAALMTGMLGSCGEDVETLRTGSSAIARKRAGDLTFTLQVLNMQDKPQDLFQEGENFQFQFIIENADDNDYVLPVPWDFPAYYDEFFALYRKTQESNGIAYIGKSFTTGGNFADASPAGVPGLGTAVYTMPWLIEKDTTYVMPILHGDFQNDDYIKRNYIAVDNPPDPVSPSEYFTGFTLKYTETDSVRMEVSFRVE